MAGLGCSDDYFTPCACGERWINGTNYTSHESHQPDGKTKKNNELMLLAPYE